MEVILRDHVENVGKRGEVVKVADGYARNYLLPRKLALVATPGNLKQIERERVKLDAKEAEEKTAAEAVATRMSGIQVVIGRKVGETEALYGSVTSADIADALAKLGYETDKRKIGLREPIKKLGEQIVPVKLHREVIVQLPVKVVAEGRPEVIPAELKANAEPQPEKELRAKS
jgi:large subunit ribosomal protein L9